MKIQIGVKTRALLCRDTTGNDGDDDTDDSWSSKEGSNDFRIGLRRPRRDYDKEIDRETKYLIIRRNEEVETKFRKEKKIGTTFEIYKNEISKLLKFKKLMVYMTNLYSFKSIYIYISYLHISIDTYGFVWQRV